MNKLINIIKYLLVGILFIYSCNTNNKENKDPRKTSIKVNIPNVIMLNDTLRGVIEYTSVLDTITLKKDEDRFVFLYMAKTKKRIMYIEEFKALSNIDTFVPFKENKIHYYNTQCKDVGKFYLYGYIEDVAYLKGKEEEKTRVITMHTSLNDSVYVKERDSVGNVGNVPE